MKRREVDFMNALVSFSAAKHVNKLRRRRLAYAAKKAAKSQACHVADTITDAEAHNLWRMVNT